MNRFAAGARGFGAFWWDFIIGDDWRIAAGVIVALVGTAALHRADVSAWWLVPAAVAGLLAWSLHRATRPAPGPGSATSADPDGDPDLNLNRS